MKKFIFFFALLLGIVFQTSTTEGYQITIGSGGAHFLYVNGISASGGSSLNDPDFNSPINLYQYYLGEEPSVIAIMAMDPDEFKQGLIVSSDDGFSTTKRWRCVDVDALSMADDWYLPEYDDSFWPEAMELGDKYLRLEDMDPSLLSDDAKWIWNTNFSDNILCRGNFDSSTTSATTSTSTFSLFSTTTTLSTSMSVTCSPDEIVASLDVSGLVGSPGTLYVGDDPTDPACLGQVADGVATFRVLLDNCGVYIEDKGDDTIRHTYHYVSEADDDVIYSAVGGEFFCDFASNELINTEFTGLLVASTYVGSASGHYGLSMELLNEDNLQPAPSQVPVGSRLLVHVHFDSPDALRLVVASCWAEPKDDDSLQHFLLQDGCVPSASEGFVIPRSELATPHDFYLQFTSFVFKGHVDPDITNVLTCDVHVCMVDDPDCSQVAVCSKKRELNGPARSRYSTGKLEFYIKQ